MNDAYVTICGNATADPQPLRTTRGETMAKIRLASSPSWYDPEQRQWKDRPASYLDVLAFRNLAKHVLVSVSKGDPIVVHGKMRVVQWERDGRSGTNVEIEAVTVGHDLARGVTGFTKASAAEPVRRPGPVYPSTDTAIDPMSADTDPYVMRSA